MSRRGRLPGQNLGNGDFQNEFGPQNRNLRQQVFPGRQLRGVNWTIQHQPTNEPGIFTDRLIFRYESNMMVPSTYLANPSDRQIENLWGNNWSILQRFTAQLTDFVTNSGENFSYFRMYLIHDNNDLEIVGGMNARQERANLFNFTRGWQARLRQSLARALQAFTDDYVEEEGDEQFRQIGMIRVFVDLAPADFGGGVLQKFPPHLKCVQAYLFNPSNKQCFFKCIRKFTGETLPSLQAMYVQFDDFQDYKLLFEKSITLFPKLSFRLMSSTGMLRDRIDGAEFEGEDEHVCCLLLDSQHWFLIQDIHGFVKGVNGNEFYCLSCDTQEQNLSDEHVCQDWRHCDRCNYRFKNTQQLDQHKAMQLLDPNLRHTCDYCGRANFYSEACYSHHVVNCLARTVHLRELERSRQRDRNRVRQQTFRENNPGYRNEFPTYREDKYHCFNCGVFYGRAQPELHVCYLEKRDLKDPMFKEWYAFDYECMLTPDPDNPGIDIHSVNYVCVAKLWSDQTWQFASLDDFFNWLATYLVPRATKEEKIGMVAHNLKGYDGRLTLAKMFELQAQRGALVDDMIWTLSKINTFTWQNIVFRDSLLHIPQALASFPKTFDLRGDDVEISKGYFPYLFNTPENQNYVGPMPAIHYFQPNLKSGADRVKFLKWYDQHRNDVYDFQEELKKYCIADVNILARGLEVYSEAGKKLNGDQLDPLEKLTIASYTTNCWFTNHFPEKTIAWHPMWMADNARRALRGGRTDIRVFYRKYSMEDVFVKKKYGLYVDVQSMYPFVMYKRDYPVGKPKFLQSDQCTLELLRSKFGFAEVDIEPPAHYVHHPALVHVHNDRLCSTLLPWKNQVFTTVEICDALDQGWTVSKIHWIQYYDQRSSDLFKAYIEKLVSEKIHSSKIEATPDEVEFLKRKWMEEFRITFDAAAAEYNAGRRALAKLMLNSLWGKLSEKFKPAFSKNVTAEEFRAYEDEELAGKIRIKQKFRLGANAWFLSGERDMKKDNFYLRKNQCEHNNKTCVEIGAYVTMWGRRMLWQEMNKLGKRVLYHDTDSIIYEYDESQMYNVQEGHVLGDWEVEHGGNPIIEFVGLAPKTYAYRYLDMKNRVPYSEDLDFTQFTRYEIYDGYVYPVVEECKVKGFKLHYDARQIINFDGLLELYRQEKVALQAKQLVFEYNREQNQIRSRLVDKALVFYYEKGVIGSQDQSYPFGVDKYWNPDTLHVDEGEPIRVQ